MKTLFLAFLLLVPVNVFCHIIVAEGFDCYYDNDGTYVCNSVYDVIFVSGDSGDHDPPNDGDPPDGGDPGGGGQPPPPPMEPCLKNLFPPGSFQLGPLQFGDVDDNGDPHNGSDIVHKESKVIQLFQFLVFASINISAPEGWWIDDTYSRQIAPDRFLVVLHSGHYETYDPQTSITQKTVYDSSGTKLFTLPGDVYERFIRGGLRGQTDHYIFVYGDAKTLGFFDGQSGRVEKLFSNHEPVTLGDGLPIQTCNAIDNGILIQFSEISNIKVSETGAEPDFVSKNMQVKTLYVQHPSDQSPLVDQVQSLAPFDPDHYQIRTKVLNYKQGGGDFTFDGRGVSHYYSVYGKAMYLYSRKNSVSRVFVDVKAEDQLADAILSFSPEMDIFMLTKVYGATWDGTKGSVTLFDSGGTIIDYIDTERDLSGALKSEIPIQSERYINEMSRLLYTQGPRRSHEDTNYVHFLNSSTRSVTSFDKITKDLVKSKWVEPSPSGEGWSRYRDYWLKVTKREFSVIPATDLRVVDFGSSRSIVDTINKPLNETTALMPKMVITR